MIPVSITRPGQIIAAACANSEVQSNANGGAWQVGQVFLRVMGSTFRNGRGERGETYGIRVRSRLDQVGNLGAWSNESFTSALPRRLIQMPACCHLFRRIIRPGLQEFLTIRLSRDLESSGCRALRLWTKPTWFILATAAPGHPCW
ncbi:MAG: hypothetical protein IPK53_19380 [bacterium]|nr:hypothetical protein [bacterium]